MHRSWFPAGGTALGLLVLFGIPARRRKLRAWLGMLLLFAGVSIGMTACSGGSSGGSTPPVTHPGTTAGTYVVTVTATSGAVSAKTTLQVIVD
jgi:trimeric autotransporter adhesin